MFHTCGLKTDGAIACWGLDEQGEASPPEGEFSYVSAGRQRTCGLKPDNSVLCWGYRMNGVISPLEGDVTSISVGEAHACGVTPDGSVTCWGTHAGIVAPQELTSAVTGVHYTCGRKNWDDYSSVCWGRDAGSQATP